MTSAPARPLFDRALATALALALFAMLSGCLSEVTVLEPDEDGAATNGPGRTDGFGNAGAAAPVPNAGHQSDPVMGQPSSPSTQTPPVEGLMGAPPVRDISALCGGGPPVMGSRCSVTSTELLTELPDIYQLSATTDQLYVAAWDGIHRVQLSDGTIEQLYDEYTTRVLAEDERFYWVDEKSLGLNVQSDDGPSAEFLPTHSNIDGLSQDDGAIYALTDGFVFRVPKETEEPQPLVDGTGVMQALHWSGLAVDDEHVYFISYPGDLVLERIGKDGKGRMGLSAGLGGAMDRQSLLVDDRHVYLAGSFGGLQRVPVIGGEAELLGRVYNHGTADPLVAQDDDCLYYADLGIIYCLSKTECTTEIVYTADEGVINALTMHGSELYFGVYVDAPAATPKGWVGSLQCPAEG
jgi:hypothetical protein